MTSEEFAEKMFFISSYVETENGATLEALADQFVFGVDGLPLEWVPKIDNMPVDQRTEMAALIPDTHTGWLAAFRVRLLDF